ncbi:SUMF1/EgtB/PvdO family nonheme iron enzyme [Dapis sp. BLCC M126]|uniref:SUMF1/EgtB/PvdO family nonheme iron enzyme n=1 Tax=Dapis sp. BLCC M126 TaxID=3400189 RepID=UPI003CECE4CB
MVFPLPLLPFAISTGAAAWNGMVNAFNGASGRTMQKNLEGQRLVHQKELQEKQKVAQLEIEYMRTMSQIKLQQNNQQFQLDLQQNNQEFQAGIEYQRLAAQAQLQQNNQEFQQKLEIARQKFQAKIVEYQCQENRKLQEFIKAVDMQIAKSNQEFQAWLFQENKQVQIELAQYNRETQFILAECQREAALQIKELDNWPIKNYPWHILEYHQGRNPIPVQIILASPEIDFDRFEHLNKTSTSTFPKVEKRLSQCLKNFLQKYYSLENQERPTELIDHTWDSNRFAGGSAVKAIFSRLKSEPILLIESEVDGDLINIQVAYWSGGQEISPFYKTIISHLHYPKILYEFAIQRALHWETNVKQKLLAQGKSEPEIDREYGADNLLNLQIYRKFEQDKLAGIDFERHYKTNSEDFGKLSALLGAYHNIIAALFTDIHYLITTNLSPKLPELLPELETEFSVDKRLADDLFQMVVESYIGSLRAMEKDRSELVPEFAADIAFRLTGLSNPTFAEKMLDFALESWLNSRYLSVENGREKFDVVAENLLPLDREFVVKVNRCLVGLGKEKKLSVINSCYQRGIEKFNLEKYEEAVIDFGYVIDFDSEFVDGYYRRGLTYIQLANYQEAVEDLTQVVRLDASHAPAYNYRGNAYYKLGEYQQAVDDYERAINLGLNEAVKNRDIALGVWQEIKRQAEEKIRREKKERQEREAEEKRRRESQGELFSFEVVTVNNSGKIINRAEGSARQKIADLGNGIKLEMVYVPGGSFLMGSPENEAERNSDESPQHQVTIQPFYMSKYPITQNQYQAIIGKNPSNFKGGSRPVEKVNWHNAVEFCRKLSEKTGKIYRLPSESQWEYACRAGTTTPFYFGETITPDLVNYDGNYPYGNAPKGKYRQETTDVGSFPPNAFGLYDMHGNVWEWCLDVWHENYNGAPTDGSAWETGGDNSKRLLRSGCWDYISWDCRSARRLYYVADNHIYGRGFRVVLSVSRS